VEDPVGAVDFVAHGDPAEPPVQAPPVGGEPSKAPEVPDTPPVGDDQTDPEPSETDPPTEVEPPEEPATTPDEPDPPADEPDPPADEPEPPAETEPTPGTVAECFAALTGAVAGPEYDQFAPVVGSHCKGTDHQDITDIDRVVFLGDSVTAGTPPTAFWEYYTALLTGMLIDRFGIETEFQNCAQWGARMDDLLIGKKEIADCFPDTPDPRRTLVVMTNGGNDVFAWAKDGLDAESAIVEADAAAALLEEAIEWFKAPGRFPNGIFIVYANPFEYTDATGNTDSCALASLAGLSGNWIEGAPAVVHFHERLMEIAVKNQVDMVFSLEHFCGHGFEYQNPDGQCYAGPDAELWFDLTCIHPNPTGHAAMADLFISVIDE